MKSDVQETTEKSYSKLFLNAIFLATFAGTSEKLSAMTASHNTALCHMLPFSNC